MTTAIITILDYGRNLEKAHNILQMERYLINMLEKNRFTWYWYRNAPPKHLHAITLRGFELKLALFVLACSIN